MVKIYGFRGDQMRASDVSIFFQAAEEAKKREKELAEAEKSAGKMGDILEFLTVFEDLYNS